MTLSRMLEPDQDVLARSDAIVEDLEQLIGAEAVIADEDGRRAYETDALTAYRLHAAGRGAAALDRGGLARARAIATSTASRWWRAAPAPRCRAARCPPRTPS